MYDDLELIRKLRNHAAHTVGALKFDSPKVVALAERLVGADHAVIAMEKQKRETQGPSERSFSRKTRDRTGGRPAGKGHMERMRLELTLSYIGGSLQANEQIVRQVEMPGSLKSKILRIAELEGADTYPGREPDGPACHNGARSVQFVPVRPAGYTQY